MATELDLLLKEMSDIKAFWQQHLDEKTKPLAEEIGRMQKSLADTVSLVRDLRRERIAAIGDGRLRVPDGRLAGYDLLDLRILGTILKGRQGRARFSDNLLVLIEDNRAALRAMMTPEGMLAWEDGCLTRRGDGVDRIAGRRSLETFRGSLAGWTRTLVEMQQKALDSTTTGAGDELVPTFEAAELWLDVNLDTLILPLLPQTAMPTNPFDMPAQLGDSNWYPSSENVQITTTDVSTAKITMTAYGLKTGVPFSDELEEDAVIALVPEIRRSLVRNAAEVIDDVLLNADTTVTNGINSDGATITASTAGKGHWLLGFDGIVHQAIVDNSAGVSIDHAGANMTADGANALLTKLGRYAVPRRRGDVVYVADVNTATRMLSITEFETIDVAGARATLSTGEIINVYGKPLIQSEQMRLADADGKVTSAGNATDTGRLLVFNSTQWRVGFRRNITVETEREAGKGQTTMYVSFRIALAQRAASRGTATHTAIKYNVKLT